VFTALVLAKGFWDIKMSRGCVIGDVVQVVSEQMWRILKHVHLFARRVGQPRGF
jgi:hypothetical protein